MFAFFLMNVKKCTKITLVNILKFETAITPSKIVQMRSSFAHMASFSVLMIDTKKTNIYGKLFSFRMAKMAKNCQNLDFCNS